MNKTEVVQLVDYDAYAEHFDIPNGGFTKDVKRFEASQRRNDPSQPVYVGVAAVDRCFGGLEEGGWYYDWYQIEEILQCQDFRHLLSTVRSLREQYPSSRFGRYSAAGGRDHIIYMSRSKKLIEDIQSTERTIYG